jgi:membrane fusion protein (multidrug efflux system)
MMRSPSLIRRFTSAPARKRASVWRRLGLLLTAALACTGCEPAPDADPQPVPPPIAVRVAAIRRGSIQSVLKASGETAALRTLRVASPVAGRVSQLAVQVGDAIAANAVVARVVPIENDAAVRGLDMLRAAGALRADEQTIAQRQARDLSGRDVPLSVPFVAVVADRLHNSGEYVAANEVLLEVFDPRSLVAVAQVPVDALGLIDAGQRVSVHAAGAQSPGTVVAVAATVAPQSVTVPVRIALDGALAPPLLRAPVECDIIVAEHRDVLLIPRSALLATDEAGNGAIMVAEGERARRRAVRLGLRDAESVEIVEGLVDGDLVLVDGGLALPDGTAIAVQTAPVS